MARLSPRLIIAGFLLVSTAFGPASQADDDCSFDARRIIADLKYQHEALQGVAAAGGAIIGAGVGMRILRNARDFRELALESYALTEYREVSNKAGARKALQSHLERTGGLEAKEPGPAARLFKAIIYQDKADALSSKEKLRLAKVVLARSGDALETAERKALKAFVTSMESAVIPANERYLAARTGMLAAFAEATGATLAGGLLGAVAYGAFPEKMGDGTMSGQYARNPGKLLLLNEKSACGLLDNDKKVRNAALVQIERYSTFIGTTEAPGAKPFVADVTQVSKKGPNRSPAVLKLPGSVMQGQ